MEETTFTVEVPAGVERRVDAAAGRPRRRRPARRPNGSLFVHLAVTPDPRFERQGDNLHTTLTVGVAQAALGTEAQVESLDGPQRVTWPPAPSTATSSGSAASACRTCAAAGGATSSCTSWSRRRPTLSAEQDELLRQFAASRGEEVAPPGSGGRRGRVLAPALRLWLAPRRRLRRHHRARRGGGPGLRRRARRCRCSPTRTSTTWAGCCACGRAKRSSRATARALGPDTLAGRPRGRAATGRARESAATAPVQPEAARRCRVLTVAFAPVKGERPEWVVQKLTELGIDRIVPLPSGRSVVRWSGRTRHGDRRAAAPGGPRGGGPVPAGLVARGLRRRRFADLASLGGPGEVVLAQLSGDRPTRVPARGGRRPRGWVEHRRARLGAARRSASG